MQPKTSARLRRRGKSRRGEPNKQARDNRSKKELSARAQRAAERARKREARTAAADRAEKGSTPSELSRQKQEADKQKGKGKAKRKQKQKLAPAKKKHKRATLSLMGDVATVQPRHQGRQACGRQGRQQHRDQQQHWRQMHEQQQDRRIAYALEMMHRQRRLLDNQQLQLEQIRRRLCDMQTWHCCRSSDAGNAGRSATLTHLAAAPIMAGTLGLTLHRPEVPARVKVKRAHESCDGGEVPRAQSTAAAMRTRTLIHKQQG